MSALKAQMTTEELGIVRTRHTRSVDSESWDELVRRLKESDARLWAIAHKLGIEKEKLPGQLAAQIVEAIDKLQNADPVQETKEGK